MKRSLVPLTVVFLYIAHFFRIDHMIFASHSSVPMWFRAVFYFALVVTAALVVATSIDLLKWVFADWAVDDRKTSAVISLLSGAVSLLFLPIVLSPVAILCGAFSAIAGNRAGWLGIVLGVLGLIGALFFTAHLPYSA